MYIQILYDKHEKIWTEYNGLLNAYQFEIVTYKNFNYVREIFPINKKNNCNSEYDRRKSLKTK